MSDPLRPSPGRPRSTIDDTGWQSLNGRPAGQRPFHAWRPSSRSASITSTTSSAVTRRPASTSRERRPWAAHGRTGLGPPLPLFRARHHVTTATAQGRRQAHTPHCADRTTTGRHGGKRPRGPSSPGAVTRTGLEVESTTRSMGPMANKEVHEEHLTTDLPRNASDGIGVTCEQITTPAGSGGYRPGWLGHVLRGPMRSDPKERPWAMRRYDCLMRWDQRRRGRGHGRPLRRRVAGRGIGRLARRTSIAVRGTLGSRRRTSAELLTVVPWRDNSSMTLVWHPGGLVARLRATARGLRYCTATAMTAADIHTTADGADHTNMATRHSNLGTVLVDLGDLAGARTHHEPAWRSAKPPSAQPPHDGHHPRQPRPCSAAWW
jgi:hypothetical protein